MHCRFCCTRRLRKDQAKENALVQDDKRQHDRPPLQPQDLLDSRPLNPLLPLHRPLARRLARLWLGQSRAIRARGTLVRAHAYPSEGRDGELPEAEHDRRDQYDSAEPRKDDKPDVPSDKGFWTGRQTNIA